MIKLISSRSLRISFTFRGENHQNRGGFFRIRRGSNECEIENYVLSSLADVHEGKNGRQLRRAGRRATNKVRD